MRGHGEAAGGEPGFARELPRTVAAFSAGWLAAASLVGVWMATLLVRPAWGAVLGEWTYGRWAALHLNWQLYGWCSLPMVGLLLKRYLRPGPVGMRQARWALSAWSLALALGGLSWLQGDTSGKLFLDWAGVPRLLFIAALVFLWGLLLWNAFGNPAAGPTRRKGWADYALLIALAAVPAALYFAAGRRVYPAIDPGTGGPTGASLLGSTLVIVLVMALMPKLLGLANPPGRSGRVFWTWFGLDGGICLLLNHGASSHRQWAQILGLGSLLVWVPVLAWHLRGFAWNPASRPWLAATLWWWSALVVSGFVSFLPGVLDRFKFTHALVAHAHLAMAGLLTSLNMLILLNLATPGGDAALAPLGSRWAFRLWHGGLLLHLAALAALASVEISAPGRLFSAGDPPKYLLRLLAGTLMAGASVYWAAALIRQGNTLRPEAALP